MKNKCMLGMVLLALSASVMAAPISSSSNGSDWVRASSVERLQYASRIVNTMNANYSARALANCINEVFYEPSLRGFKVSEMPLDVISN